jgi:hypothetical protein
MRVRILILSFLFLGLNSVLSATDLDVTEGEGVALFPILVEVR